ncbi:MAG: putative ABC transporter permease, partial [Evtepia sp.]
FFGFLLEISYAYVTQSRKPDRKCFCFLPLCPVYGFGALAILGLPNFILTHPILLFLIGGLTATAAEYLTGFFYEYGTGVKFWDYTKSPGNISGRICLLFTTFWSILALVLVFAIQPMAEIIIGMIPVTVWVLCFVLLAVDAPLTLFVLKRSGTTEVLRWKQVRLQ